jgi:hypothetical protein
VIRFSSIVYAEVSIGYARAEQVAAVMPADRFRREILPYEAAFLAGKAFLAHRRRGGRRSCDAGLLHRHPRTAAWVPMQTRDAARYRTYFPAVRLIAP